MVLALLSFAKILNFKKSIKTFSDNAHKKKSGCLSIVHAYSLLANHHHTFLIHPAIQLNSYQKTNEQ